MSRAAKSSRRWLCAVDCTNGWSISVIPSDSELETAQSPLDLGRLYGYREEDIAHYYWSRRRDCQTAYIEYVRDFENAKILPGRPATSRPK